MRKLLILAVLGGVAYGLRKLYEDSYEHQLAADRQKAPDDLADDLTGDASDDDRLDEALRESFPASDPPAVGPQR